MVFSRIHYIFTKSQWIIRNNYENLFITAIFLTKIYALLNKPCVIYLYQFPNNSNENIRKKQVVKMDQFWGREIFIKI